MGDGRWEMGDGEGERAMMFLLDDEGRYPRMWKSGDSYLPLELWVLRESQLVEVASTSVGLALARTKQPGLPLVAEHVDRTGQAIQQIPPPALPGVC